MNKFAQAFFDELDKLGTPLALVPLAVGAAKAVGPTVAYMGADAATRALTRKKNTQRPMRGMGLGEDQQ